MVSGVLNSGILVEGAKINYEDASPEIIEKRRKLQAVCDEFSLPAAALQFSLGHPAVTTVIPGCRTPFEVQRSVETLDAQIPLRFRPSSGRRSSTVGCCQPACPCLRLLDACVVCYLPALCAP